VVTVQRQRTRAGNGSPDWCQRISISFCSFPIAGSSPSNTGASVSIQQPFLGSDHRPSTVVLLNSMYTYHKRGSWRHPLQKSLNLCSSVSRAPCLGYRIEGTTCDRPAGYVADFCAYRGNSGTASGTHRKTFEASGRLFMRATLAVQASKQASTQRGRQAR
jgi:hypothetical protein